MQDRAPRLAPKKTGSDQARVPSPSTTALALAAFNQRHKQEFFRYKDLQSEKLFGPAMAFRITRTPGWLSPALKNGHPKYLPEDVFAVIARLRAGETPDPFEACLGRGKSLRKSKKTQNSQNPTKKPSEAHQTGSTGLFSEMSYSPLTPCKIRRRGQIRWRIIIGRDWAPILKCKPGARRIFSTSQAAESFAHTAQLRLNEFAKGNGSFTDAEYATCRLALSLVKGDCQKLLDAVRQFVKVEESKPAARPVLTRVVARHYLMTRNLNGAFRAKTLPTARYEARVFLKDFGDVMIGDPARNDIQRWIRKLKFKAKSKKNILGTVKLIFDHSIKLGLRTDNPATGVELPRIDQAEPERFTASECEILLKTAVRINSPFLVCLAIELFTGARPAEVTRTLWKKVSLQEERINIPGAAEKRHKFRWIRIYPILRLWLEFIGIKKRGPIVPGCSVDVYEAWRHKLAVAAGLEKIWPHDALRHTHASFDYAIKGDFKAVADNLGNTVHVSRNNYIAPASLTEANQFLALTPEHILKLIAEEDRQKQNGASVK